MKKVGSLAITYRWWKIIPTGFLDDLRFRGFFKVTLNLFLFRETTKISFVSLALVTRKAS